MAEPSTEAAVLLEEDGSSATPTDLGGVSGRTSGGLSRVVVRRLLRQGTGVLGIVIVGAWILLAIIAPMVAPSDPNVQHTGSQLLSPGTHGYLLGTDQLGRDILSRVLYGARIAVAVSMVAVALGGLVGTAAGLLSGYFGGLFETIIMRVSDLLLAYPGILLGVVVVAVLGPGTLKVAIAIAIINFPIFARLARSSVLRERELDYVAAAQLEGCPWPRILFRHVFPNCMGPLLVQASISVAHAVLIEASLSFLGLGAQPPTASWGAMLNDSRAYLSQTWTYAIFPGIALATLLLGLNFLADALRNALDPTAEGR